MGKKQRYGYLFLAAFLWGAILAVGSTETALAGTGGEIRLKKQNITVGIGEDYTETIVIRQGKKKIAGRQFRFRTTDRKIATVNERGIIQGKKPGNVRIICTQTATGKKYICRVTVQRYVEEITVGEGYLNFFEIGEKQKIDSSIYPKKATVRKLKYISSNPEVVTVSSKGIATCTGTGTATITVRATDAQKTEAALDVCLVSGYQEPFGISEKQEMPHGKTTAVRYPQKDSDQKARAVVYTPPGYTPEKQYNVMYLLHGAGDNENSWTQNGGAAYIMDYLYSKNLAEDMILVMPDTWWEEDILDSLQPYIARQYSIASGPEHTALAGYSMGGGAAAEIGLRHTDCFAYLGLFSPANGSVVKEYLYDKLPAGEGPLFTHPLKGVWLSVGSGDQVVGSATKTAKTYFEKDRTKQYFAGCGAWYHYYTKETDAPHSWKEWRNGLYNFARMAFK